MERKKILSLLLTILMVAMLFAGCGTSNSSDTSKSSDSSDTTKTSDTTKANDSSDTSKSSESTDTTDTSETTGQSASAEGIKIGVSINDLQLERWQRDWKFMEAECKELDIECVSASADGDVQTQMTQIESMLSQDIDVLIVIPVNQDTLSQAVEMAHEQNVKVIAYDRLITNTDLDYYITFDMIGVGELQAQFLIDLVPTGKYFLLEGPTTDSNAQLFHQGQMNVLQEYIDNGDIEIVGEQWADGWSEESAMGLTENILTANDNNIDAIVAANDSTASGAVMALEAQGLAGSIPITGQDCDLAACKRIVAGTQTMSVYKNLEDLAKTAINAAVSIAQGEEIETNDTYNNGQIDVPTLALELQACTKDNIDDTVIADGFHTKEDVYGN